MNYALARELMVKQQVRTWNVLNEQVLQLLEDIPREMFIPGDYQQVAYADDMTPIGFGQVALSPKCVGKILQELNIKKSDSILEIGSGTGYVTAMLAKLGDNVDSVEIIPQLAQIARENLKQLAIDNAKIIEADAAQGYGGTSTYDIIVITGSLSSLPPAFQSSLAEGGKIFAIIGESPAMEAMLIEKNQGKWEYKSLFETDIPMLINASQPSKFKF